MKRIVFAGLGWRLGNNQAHCSRALRIQLIELNRGGAYGVWLAIRLSAIDERLACTPLWPASGWATSTFRLCALLHFQLVGCGRTLD